MSPELVSITLERVENGWVVHGWSRNCPRHEGYMADGTMVAATPDKLSEIIHRWASSQQDAPKKLAG